MNILLITADQWRGDSLGCVGHPVVRTPNLDALAADGTLFRQHWANAYPCGPSRASLLTGLYPHKHRSVRNGTPLDARHPTLASEARRAGYRPMLFGYTDTSLDPRGREAGDPARDTYESVLPGFEAGCLLTEAATPWLEHLEAEGHDVDPAGDRYQLFRLPQPTLDAVRHGFGPAPFAAEDSETAFLTDQFLEWLARQRSELPWFAHLSYVAPHPPCVAAEPWFRMFDPAGMPLPNRTIESRHPLSRLLYEGMPLDDYVPGLLGLSGDADSRTVARIRATYWGLIAEVDHHLGRVVAALKQQGAYDQTMILFTSDHGELLFDHGMLGKQGWFDQAAHVPLIIRHPRAPKGSRVDAFTESIDLMPTILEAIGVAAPRNCDGRSLAPFCHGGAPADWRREAHWSWDFGDPRGRAIESELGLSADETSLQVLRGRRIKYVHFAALPPLLYDLADDPDERIDRTQDPAYQGERRDAAERLLAWRARHEERTLDHITLRNGYFEAAR